MRQGLLLSLLTVAMVAGCGRPMPELARPVSGVTTQSTAARQNPLQLPAWNMGPLEPGPIVAQVAQAWSRVRTLGGRYAVQQVADGQSQTAAFSVTYRKPGRFRYEVERAPAAFKSGSTLVFDTRSGDLTTRLGSIAGLIPLHKKLSEDRSETVLGHALDQGNYERLVEMLLAPQAQVRLISALGAPVVLALDHPGLPGVDELRLGIDARTNLIQMVEQVKGGQVTVRSTITDLRVNPAFEAKSLEL